MAFVNNAQIAPSGLNSTLKFYGRGLRFNNDDCEINMYTKLTGDTTGTVNSTLVDVQGVIVIDAAGGIVPGVAATITKSSGLAVIALASLGAGTAGMILIYGTRAR